MPNIDMPNVNDALPVLINKITELSEKLPYIQQGGDYVTFRRENGIKDYGKYDESGKWRYGKFPATQEEIDRKFNQYKSLFPRTNRGYIYSPDNCLELQDKITQLVLTINGIKSSSDTQKKRVLHAAFEAIYCPTEENCKKLHKIANEVDGHGNGWKKIALIGIGIVLLLTFILPGLVYFAGVENDIRQCDSQGLSKATSSIVSTIEKTKAPLRMKHNSFFTESREAPKKEDEIIIPDSRVASNDSMEEPSAPPCMAGAC